MLPCPRRAPAGLWRLARRLVLLLPALPGLAAPPPDEEFLPPPSLRPAWEAAGRPTVVMLPDHLGPDARLAFHAAPMLARGLSIVVLAPPAAPGIELGHRLRPRAPEGAATAEALLPGLFALLRWLAAEDSPRLAVGLLGFGTGGEAALLAAEAALAPPAPRFRAHAALYPTCGTAALRAGRMAGAPRTGAPILIILPHAGAAGDLPGGCAGLLDPPPAPVPDQVTLRAYDGLGYGFDLWPAIAWQERDPGFDRLRFDALRAELARQDLARFFAGALLPAGALRMTGR